MTVDGFAAADVYARSFGSKCAGTIPALVTEVGAIELGQREGVPKGATRRVLDAGCGDGRLAEALARAGSRVVATDREPGMTALAASR